MATGLLVFGFALIALLELSEVWPTPVKGSWALKLLAVVVALLLGMTAARLAIGAGRASGLATADAEPAIAFRRRPWVPWALIALALLMFVAVSFALLGVVRYADVPNELSLPVLAIAGVIALLGSLALVSVSFSLVNMADKTQALGLPQGSVRAVIALSLVVLFAILTVYLFSSLNGGQAQVGNCLDEPSSSRMLADWHSRDMIFRVPATTCSGSTPASSRFDVFVGRPLSPAGTDFAKQLLVLIGTLVTSVASFYFGSKAVSEARDVVAGLNVAPVLQGVEPSTLPQGGRDQSLDLLGTGLNGARQVQVTRGQDQINAISVTSNDNRVHAKFNVPDNAVAGGPGWDVTVTDGQGRNFRLPAAVTIVAKDATDKGVEQGGGAPQSAPDLAGSGSQAVGPTALAALRGKLETEKASIATLQSIDKGAVLPSPPDATLAELNLWLTAADTLAKGPADATATAAAVQSGTILLEKVQNAGLPGALADVIAVLRRIGIVAGPAVVGIPAGPVGIVLGVLSGLLSLAADQQKFNAAKAALLNTPFDADTPPPMPTRDMAIVAARGTAFADASPDQALAIMQAALQRRAGQPLPADEVATTLLANPVTAPLLQQFATLALQAQAIDRLRGDALFRQARDLLADVPELDVPATAIYSCWQG